MKTKLLSLCLAMLVGMSVLADGVWNYNVYDDCSKNGYSNIVDGHMMVDLGLPSGLKWATCNVGANNPEDYGNYYAWGEILPKEDYSMETYQYAKIDGDTYKFTKYCYKASGGYNGFVDDKTTLNPEDDAAHINWGGSWRMPTADEIDELLTNCTWTWTTQNGVNGHLVTSKINSESIFLPAAGWYYDGSVQFGVGVGGEYWSSSLVTTTDRFEGDPLYAWFARIDSDTVARVGRYRNEGRTIRPVYPATAVSSHISSRSSDYLVLTLYANGCENANVINCNVGQQVNISAIPNEYRYFVCWTDGNTDNPRLVTVNEDLTLIAEFAPISSGQCGENLYWKYAGHTLTISGMGAMYDYSGNDMPWLLFRDTTDMVVLPQGIAHIGNNAFNGFAKLNKIELPSTLTSIGANAFAGCRKLYDIYSYAVEPPVADNRSFANYNVYLHVPCDNLRDYQLDAVFGSFKYIQCLGAENTTTDEDVTVTPSGNEATFVWRADGSADTYTLEIRKDGEVFCTLVFNAGGQLSSIAFAPSRNGLAQHAAEQTAAGFRFTVTGLSESTRYTFGMTVKDANNATLQTYTGEFKTTGTATALDNAATEPTAQKIVRHGQVLILRGNKTYTTMGVEVNE